MELGSIHLMAPACTTAFFREFYEPFLRGGGALKLQDKIYLYNLSDELEQDDKVGLGGLPGYGRSLLYLVSRAYEDSPNTPLRACSSTGATFQPRASSRSTSPSAQTAHQPWWVRQRRQDTDHDHVPRARATGSELPELIGY